MSPTLAPSYAPTSAPTASIDRFFWPVLPAGTVDLVRSDPSSPQYQAYQWATAEDRVPQSESTDVQRLERMTRRFALATLFVSTGGAVGLGDQWRMAGPGPIRVRMGRLYLQQ